MEVWSPSPLLLASAVKASAQLTLSLVEKEGDKYPVLSPQVISIVQANRRYTVRFAARACAFA